MQKSINKLTAKRIILSIIGIIILFFATHPNYIPFVNHSSKSNVTEIMSTYMGQFNKIVENILNNSDKLIAIILIFIVVYIIRTVTTIIFKFIHFENRHKETLKVLLESVIGYGAVLVGIIVSLSILGVNMTALFASVGLVSLIVGFSAQHIIYDIIAGIFLIFEGQLNVGDIVTINGFRGTVAKIGIRTTQLLDVGGNIQIVNNSDINNVQNLSRRNSVAVCDIGMSYNQSIEEAEKVINKTIPYIQKKYPDVFKVAPVYLGVQNLGSSSVDLRIAANVDEGFLYQAKRLMNREFKLAFDANNIEIPFNQLVVTNLDGNAAAQVTFNNGGNIIKDTDGFKVNTSKYNGGNIGIISELEDVEEVDEYNNN
ncbi:mechanosensitive ion channel family protein [Clostridium sp. SM-530-WT-3G]|uniref:mechanosensitive ion channel family protein n=1 Tax=Clostridium sp. SM-530-WT-3G TaxID=2725303 RepID=UPI00145C8ABF|nr:mechanosensitive ion channel family protein [Clostridium sp. SM-530-WT-3G]NME82144.1 mechanosensitive ion channel family protein [Clostridium sp. SM-530-WT-3G]